MRAVLRAPACSRLILIRNGAPESPCTTRALAVTPAGTRPRTSICSGWTLRRSVWHLATIKTPLSLSRVVVGRVLGT